MIIIFAGLDVLYQGTPLASPIPNRR